jgi:5-methylcytosine-specific restriction enzyme A
MKSEQGKLVLEVGQEYRRRELHEKYGGQWQGGISTPSDQKAVFIFTSDAGKQHGYSDGWTENNTYLYTGEGQRGDMEFIRGNKAIHDHIQDGKVIYLFSQVRQGWVRFEGEMALIGSQTRTARDTDGKMRKVIVFELKRVE